MPQRGEYMEKVAEILGEGRKRVLLIGGWPTFAFPVAHTGKKPTAPPFAVFERWESMLRAVMKLAVPSTTFQWRSKVKSGTAGRVARSCPPFCVPELVQFPKVFMSTRFV